MPANLENSAVATGLEKVFSFQHQREAMSNNVQTTAQLHSSNMLAKQCSTFSKRGFNNTWTKNFQMFKLDSEKAEELEVKLPTSIGSSKKQKSSRKTSTFAILTMPEVWLWITTNYGKFLRDGNTRPPHLPLKKSVCRLRTVRSGHGWMDWFQIREGVYQGYMLSPC